MTTLYTEWCETNNCTHGHCPEGCEHPQPEFYAGPNKPLCCGNCYFREGVVTAIVPCNPATCRDAL